MHKMNRHYVPSTFILKENKDKLYLTGRAQHRCWIQNKSSIHQCSIYQFITYFPLHLSIPDKSWESIKCKYLIEMLYLKWFHLFWSAPHNSYRSLWTWQGKSNLFWWCENIYKKTTPCPPANSLFNVHNGPIKSAKIFFKAFSTQNEKLKSVQELAPLTEVIILEDIPNKFSGHSITNLSMFLILHYSK